MVLIRPANGNTRRPEREALATRSLVRRRVIYTLVKPFMMTSAGELETMISRTTADRALTQTHTIIRTRCLIQNNMVR